MLRSLRSVVAAWAPVPGRALDPLIAIHGAWEGIVGKEVADNARPQQLAGDTLMVTTTSSAWSQQLAFLEPHVITALAAIPEGARITRLRFRVGRVHPRRSGTVPKRRPPSAQTLPLAPGSAITDPVLRLRERLASRERFASHRCSACGITLESGQTCAPCAFTARRRSVERAQRLMYETPWLGFDAIAEQAGGLDVRDCEEIRRDLLRRWWEVLARAERTGRLRADGFERRIASSYLLLQSGLEPDRVSRAAMRNLLGDRLEALLFGASETAPPPRM
ncbi:MAG TPA: DUF721 domain-containing protein [Candidatus Baltobacteraceae bacterium]